MAILGLKVCFFMTFSPSIATFFDIIYILTIYKDRVMDEFPSLKFCLKSMFLHDFPYNLNRILSRNSKNSLILRHQNLKTSN